MINAALNSSGMRRREHSVYNKMKPKDDLIHLQPPDKEPASATLQLDKVLETEKPIEVR